MEGTQWVSNPLDGPSPDYYEATQSIVRLFVGRDVDGTWWVHTVYPSEYSEPILAEMPLVSTAPPDLFAEAKREVVAVLWAMIREVEAISVEVYD